MNGKFLVLLLLSFNILTLLFTYGMVVEGNYAQQEIPNYLGFFVLTANFQGDNIGNLATQGSVELTEQTDDAISDFTKQETAGTGIIDGFLSLLDGLKMVISFLALLTPFPVLAFFYSIDLPLFFVLLIGMPIFLMYGIAMLGLIRGKDF